MFMDGWDSWSSRIKRECTFSLFLRKYNNNMCQGEDNKILLYAIPLYLPSSFPQMKAWTLIRPQSR